MMKLEQAKAHAKNVGDAHDLIEEFDNCDLNDHRREGTRVHNRRNVQAGSRDNQQKPRTDLYSSTRVMCAPRTSPSRK